MKRFLEELERLVGLDQDVALRNTVLTDTLVFTTLEKDGQTKDGVSVTI